MRLGPISGAIVLSSVFAGSCTSWSQAATPANDDPPPTAVSPADEARIRRVESGMQPKAEAQSEAAATATIAERMRFYKVPGVSIAVIEDGRVAWARGYRCFVRRFRSISNARVALSSCVNQQIGGGDGNAASRATRQAIAR